MEDLTWSCLPILLLMRKTRSTNGMRKKEKGRMRKRKRKRVWVKKKVTVMREEIIGKVTRLSAR